jgi:hypothetical protein
MLEVVSLPEWIDPEWIDPAPSTLYAAAGLISGLFLMLIKKKNQDINKMVDWRHCPHHSTFINGK